MPRAARNNTAPAEQIDAAPVERNDADRRVRQAERMARVLRVLQFIQGKGQWDVKRLSAELECSEQTIHRLLKVLYYAGVPYYFDKAQRCYRIRPDYRFPVLNLTEHELVGQATGAAIATAIGMNLADGARVATEKLKVSANESTTKFIADAEKLISVLRLQMADHSRHQEAIRTAQWALLERKQLVGSYKTPYQAKPVQLRLHPYRLCLIKQAWYLIARPTESEIAKTYRVARFKTIRMVDVEAIAPEDFDLKAYFGDAWTVFRGDQKYQVVIDFSPEAAEIVTETTWHPTQNVKRQRDGSVRLSFHVDGLEEIVWWVLGWSGRAKVIEPPELRDLVVRQLESALTMNRE